MSTSSSSLLSNAASLTSAPVFSGVSKFAGSLQQVLTRAVGIASLPLDNLQAGLTTFQSQQSALTNLNSTFTTLQQSVASLQTALSSTLLNATISDGTGVSADVQQGALAGTYSIQVDNLGSYSTALSDAGTTAVTDPTSQGISDSKTFTLTAGGQTTTITPASSSLEDLVSAINTQAAGQVQATIVNVGSTGSPDYRLSLQSSLLGTDPVDLQDSSGNDLISSSNAGTLASYQVNGDSTPISSTSQTVTLAPGLTATLLATSDTPTTITVADDPTGLANAFSSFATAYNNAANALTEQTGQSGGSLAGDSLIYSLSGVLSQLGNYSDGSPASALANYGITLDQTGQLSVDTDTFAAAANANFPALLAALGTSTTGGFLQTATNLLTGVEDPTTGLIPTESTQVATEITDQQSRIAAEQVTVATIQSNLTSQISQADSTDRIA